MAEYIQGLLTLFGAGLLVVISFVQLRALSQQNSRDIEELKRLNERNQANIQANYESALRGEGEVKQNSIRIQNMEGKVETAFSLLNEFPKELAMLRDKFDEYERKNGK
mgnify:CR=1 FL=1